MALKTNIISDRFGISYPNAYIKLVQVFWSDQTQKTIATYSVWADQNAYVNKKEIVDTVNVDVSNMFPTIQQDIYNSNKNYSTRLRTAIKV